MSLPNIPVWEDNDSSWIPLAPLASDLISDVCVIGLGGSGLTSIRELLVKSSLSIIGLDAGDIGSGASGRNGGFLLAGAASFYHDHIKEVGRVAACAAYTATLRELDIIFKELPQDIVQRTGSLRIAADAAEEADCILQYNAMIADNLPVSMYEGVEGRGLLFPSDGVMQPLRRVRYLARKVSADGARLFGSSFVTAIESNNNTNNDDDTVNDDRTVTVRVKDGKIVTARRVIVAIDGRLEMILPELSSRVRTARLQMVASGPCTKRAAQANSARPIYSRYGYDYWQVRDDGCVALGGLRDTDEAAEWTCENTPSSNIQEGLRALLAGPGVRCMSPVTHAWAANVAYTIKGDEPIHEQVRKGVFAIGAYSGTGNVIGAVYGKKAAQWVMHELVN